MELLKSANMKELEEQRVCIKFCFKLGKSATETVQLIQQAFGDSAMSKTQCYEWFSRFKTGRTSTDDDPKPGRPSTSTDDAHVEKVNSLVRANRRLTIRELADEVNISFGSCQSILTDILGMSRVASKFVPRVLTDEQRQKRVEICQELLDRANADPDFLKTIITGDETWVYGYDVETKAQSSQWKEPNSPRAKKARMSRSNVEVMLVTFFDWQGLVYFEYVPKGQTVNMEYYLSILKRLRVAVSRKRPEMWRDRSWKLHQDNAPAHTALLVTEFNARNGTPVIPQPPYSPDLAPADFFLFSKLKSTLKGRRFDAIPDIEKNCTADPRRIPKSAFQGAFESWKKRWQRCVDAQGMYFEGDKSD